MNTTRREILRAGLAAAVAAAPFLAWAQQLSAAPQPSAKGKRILFFTKSQAYPHAVVTRTTKADGTPSDTPAFAEKLLHDWATAAGYEVVISKDGGIFTPENIATFDAFVFYTLGDLTKPPALDKSDKTPAMTEAGKAALLAAVEGGKGFVGLHSATDTFQDLQRKNDPVRMATKEAVIDPYCRMLGAEFTSHAKQQRATIRVASRAFPGLGDLKDFDMLEEWYAFTNLAPDLHVILVQDTTTMKNAQTGQRDPQYQGPPYPQTWARRHGKGHVFYTSLGHREDVWTNPLYQKILLAALAWTTGLAQKELAPNLLQACPGLAEPQRHEG